MGGGPTTSYTVSSATSVAANSKVWVIIQPTAVLNWTPMSNNSYTLKIYVQSSAPTAADTPVVSESITGGTLDQVRVFRRATAAGVIDDLKIESIPLANVNSATNWSRKTPIPWGSGADIGSTLQSHYQPTVSKPAQTYLGTDNVYTKKEDS